MEKLKVGDKIYVAETSKWSSRVNYIIDEVVRLTKTQAVLSKGTKIINEPTIDWYKKYCFLQYGNRYNRWYHQTDEILDNIKIEKEKQLIENWFYNKKFTEEEKRIVYLKFKEIDKL